MYDERDRTDHDPPDGVMYDLDLPRGDARELMVDRERLYELNGEDSRTLAAVGAFRVVPERDLGSDRDDAPDRDTLDHLRDEGLIQTIALDEQNQAVVLTGRDLLDANRREHDEGDSQALYAGVNRPRELEHDAYLYAAFREEEARIRHRELVERSKRVLRLLPLPPWLSCGKRDEVEVGRTVR